MHSALGGTWPASAPSRSAQSVKKPGKTPGSPWVTVPELHFGMMKKGSEDDSGDGRQVRMMYFLSLKVPFRMVNI